MEALAQLLKHFVIRDVIYAIGGGVVITSMIVAFDSLPNVLMALKDAPAVVSLFLAGVAWAVGYAVSDGLGGVARGLPTLDRIFCWCVPPSLPQKPSPRLQELFTAFTSTSWPSEIESADPNDLRDAANRLIQNDFGPYHRNELLRHLGGAVGECGVIASVIALIAVGVKAWMGSNDPGWPLVLAGAVLGLIASGLLVAIGWVKALQHTYAAWQAAKGNEISCV